LRRRARLDVWPAYADLMTVLAVIGLSVAASLAPQVPPRPRLRAREDLRRKVQEAARNKQMFGAIQEAQRQIDAISQRSGLAFGTDQSLQFGDDLVTFETNGLQPIWSQGGRSRLQRFCEAIATELGREPGRSAGLGSMFIVEVEGHTDSSRCPSDAHCNWWISSGRAASFVAVMRQPDYCPGGSRLNLRPIGYADTKPPTPTSAPTRRIAVRLTPNYQEIIASLPASR